MGYKISKSTSISGVIGIPSSLTDLINGSYELITETMERVGKLVAKESYMWGLSPFFRKWGVEEGDYIVIEFDNVNKKATIITGDQELITNYQENIFEKEPDTDVTQTPKPSGPKSSNEGTKHNRLLTETSKDTDQLIDSHPSADKEKDSINNSDHSHPTFSLLGAVNLNENRSIVISRRAEGEIWINEKILSNGYTGFTKKGFGVHEKDLAPFINSLICAIKDSGFRESFELTPSVSLIVSALDNNKIDIRQYKTSKLYTGFTKKGIRLDKNQTQKLVDALSDIELKNNFITQIK